MTQTYVRYKVRRGESGIKPTIKELAPCPVDDFQVIRATEGSTGNFPLVLRVGTVV